MSIVSVSEHHARVTASSAVTSTPPAAEPAIPAREHAAPVFPAEGAAEFEAPATTPRAQIYNFIETEKETTTPFFFIKFVM